MPLPSDGSTNQSSGSNSGQMSYPIDLLREVAAKVATDASMAQYEHDQAWQKYRRLSMLTLIQAVV